MHASINCRLSREISGSSFRRFDFLRKFPSSISARSYPPRSHIEVVDTHLRLSMLIPVQTTSPCSIRMFHVPRFIRQPTRLIYASQVSICSLPSLSMTQPTSLPTNMTQQTVLPALIDGVPVDAINALLRAVRDLGE